MPSYRERLRVPWWVWLVSFVGSWAFFGAIGWYASASPELLIALTTFFALLVVSVFCVLPLLWVYRFEGLYLKLGFREKIDLRWVDQIEVVQPENLKALRRVFRPRRASGKVLPVMFAGPLGLATGQLMMGGAALGALGARRRAVCPPWMHGAVLIHNMPAQSADDWLLASSHPEELAAAVREAVTAAQATVVA